jgi:hypothetical protein
LQSFCTSHLLNNHYVAKKGCFIGFLFGIGLVLKKSTNTNTIPAFGIYFNTIQYHIVHLWCSVICGIAGEEGSNNYREQDGAEQCQDQAKLGWGWVKLCLLVWVDEAILISCN